MTNFYPEKKVVPYQKTTVDMKDVIFYLQTLQLPTEVKRATYEIFRIESANGKSGINNNYIGCQLDSGRWNEKFDENIIGAVVKKENATGKERIFAAFKDFKTSVDFLADRVIGRGLFIGGKTHKIVVMDVTDKNQLARAYKKEWVSGSPSIEPSEAEKNNFLSIYSQSEKLFP